MCASKLEAGEDTAALAGFEATVCCWGCTVATSGFGVGVAEQPMSSNNSIAKMENIPNTRDLVRSLIFIGYPLRQGELLF
jgi:hypothetical protein